MSDMQKQLDELKRRVEELERRPIYYPAPVFVNPWPPAPAPGQFYGPWIPPSYTFTSGSAG